MSEELVRTIVTTADGATLYLPDPYKEVVGRVISSGFPEFRLAGSEKHATLNWRHVVSIREDVPPWINE